jgi:hypothetical protein
MSDVELPTMCKCGHMSYNHDVHGCRVEPCPCKKVRNHREWADRFRGEFRRVSDE